MHRNLSKSCDIVSSRKLTISSFSSIESWRALALIVPFDLEALNWTLEISTFSLTRALSSAIDKCSTKIANVEVCLNARMEELIIKQWESERLHLESSTSQPSKVSVNNSWEGSILRVTMKSSLQNLVNRFWKATDSDIGYWPPFLWILPTPSSVRILSRVPLSSVLMNSFSCWEFSSFSQPQHWNECAESGNLTYLYDKTHQRQERLLFPIFLKAVEPRLSCSFQISSIGPYKVFR